MDELHSLCPNNNVMKTVLKYRNKPWLVPIDSDVPQNDKYISEVRSFASSIHYYSLKSYDILRKWIRLPAPSTLRGWCSSVQCLTGFQPGIWAELKAWVLNDKQNYGITSVVVDGMSMKERVEYIFVLSQRMNISFNSINKTYSN